MMYIYYIGGYLLFFLICFASFFLPGKYALALLKVRKEDSQKIEWLGLSWFAGIAIFLITTYLSAYARIPDFYEYVILLLFVFWIVQYFRLRKYRNYSFKIQDKWIFLLIITGAIAFTSIMFFSGMETSKGLQFMGTNGVDGIRHIAYIADQVVHFPPEEPSISGMPLRGFHYFYDFLLSRFARFYFFSIEDLYFRYFPLFISLLYGVGFIMFANRITKNIVAKRFTIFLAYFARSSVIILFLLNNKIELNANAIVQPLMLIVNPFIVLSIGMLLCGLSLLPYIKKSWKYGVLFGLIIGVISEVKVYSGIIAIACLILYSTSLIIRFKKKYFFSIILTISLTGFFTAITFLPNNVGAGKLIFAPLLFFQHYMQTELFTPLHWEEKRLIYMQKSNYLRITILYLSAICIFFLLNLGIRLLIIAKVKKLMTKKFWNSDGNAILFCACVTPILIASFFIQSVSVFDTVQFFWILLSLLSIPTGIILAEAYQKKKNKIIRFILIVSLLCITIPGVYVTEDQYILSPTRTTISIDDLSVLRQIPKIVPQNAFIILLPPTQNVLASNYLLPKGTPYIAAIAQRQVYYESGWLPSPDAAKYQVRRKQIQALKNASIQCLPGEINTIIKQINSPYIITIGEYPCLTSAISIVRKIKSVHGAIVFYQLKLDKIKLTKQTKIDKL